VSQGIRTDCGWSAYRLHCVEAVGPSGSYFRGRAGLLLAGWTEPFRPGTVAVWSAR